MNTLIKFADLSDENRWLSKGFEFEFDISKGDRALLNKLIVIGEGEFTGLASSLLLPKMIKEQVPSKYTKDWTDIFVYMNIIVYEEYRHGMVIGMLSEGGVDLKRIFSNIQRDESRHLLAWKELIKDLIGSDEYHKKKVLEALEDGLHKHNAMLGRNYFKGVSDTMSIFPKGSLDTMANIKFNILEYWFGEDNPITKRDIKLGYAKFLQNNRGTS